MKRENAIERGRPFRLIHPINAKGAHLFNTHTLSSSKCPSFGSSDELDVLLPCKGLLIWWEKGRGYTFLTYISLGAQGWGAQRRTGVGLSIPTNSVYNSAKYKPITTT